MEKISSKKNNGQLLHFIHRATDFGKREELIKETQMLQLCSQFISSGTKFAAHRHISKKVSISETTAQEAWVVISGKVQARYYDVDDSLISEHLLGQGDVSVTLSGGHGYTVLEDSLIYEFKTGPYLGVELDKIFIGETASS